MPAIGGAIFTKAGCTALWAALGQLWLDRYAPMFSKLWFPQVATYVTRGVGARFGGFTLALREVGSCPVRNPPPTPSSSTFTPGNGELHPKLKERSDYLLGVAKPRGEIFTSAQPLPL